MCEYYNKVFTALLPEETVNQSKFEEIPVPDGRADEFKGVYCYNPPEKGLDPNMLSIMISVLIDNDKYLIRGKDDNELRKIRYNDIMIITYSKSNLGLIMQQFDADGIPVKVEGEVEFKKNEALNELFRIYSLVADPEDKIALYGTLTGRVFDFTIGDLVKYRSFEGEISLSKPIIESDNKLVKKIAKSINELKKFVKESQNMSPAALLASIMDHYKFYEHVEADNLEVVYYTLELIRNAEKNGIVVTLKDGRDYLSKLLSGSSDVERCLSLNNAENRVHIANLHKVKGLEAPIIILPIALAGGGAPSIRIDYLKDSTEGYLFSLNKENVQDGYHFSTKAFAEEMEKEKGALAAEEARKIYVAATRARNALIISSYGQGRNRWKDLTPELLPDLYGPMNSKDCTWHETDEVFDAKNLYEKEKKECALKDREGEKASYSLENPSRLSVVSKVTKDKDIPGSEDEAKVQKNPFAALIGTMVHKFMETIIITRGEVNAINIVEGIIDEYKTARMIPYMDRIRDNLSSVAETIIGGGYEQDNGVPADIFNTLLDADEVFCEVPFCYKEDTGSGPVIWNGIMDVVYRSEGKWHIIDYKTNAEGDDLDTKYQNQLAAYVKAFKETTGYDSDAGTYHIDV